jgi:hypothetical protein
MDYRRWSISTCGAAKFDEFSGKCGAGGQPSAPAAAGRAIGARGGGFVPGGPIASPAQSCAVGGLTGALDQGNDAGANLGRQTRPGRGDASQIGVTGRKCAAFCAA